MKKIVILLTILFILATSYLSTSISTKKDIKLTLGIFTGSNWDVPNADSYAIFDDLIKRFEDKYPNVNVEYTSGIPVDEYSDWLGKQALKGELPDVMLMLPEDFSIYARTGLLAELETFAIKDATFDKNLYYASSYKAGLYNDDLYALPYESVPTLMFVNKTLLEKEGIDVPDKDWDWDDFYEICQKVSKDYDYDGILDQFGVYGYDWEEAVYANDVQLFDESGKNCYINTDRMKEVVNFVRKIKHLNQNVEVVSNDFDEGKVAFCPMQFSQYRAYMPYPYRVKKFSTFEWDCIPLPKAKEGDNSSKIETLLVAISEKSKYKEEAWNLMKMLSCDENTQQNIFNLSQGVSVLKKVTQSEEAIKSIMKNNPGDSDFEMDVLNEVMEKGENEPNFPSYFTISEQLVVELYKIIDSTTSIDTELKKLQKKINKILKE